MYVKELADLCVETLVDLVNVANCYTVWTLANLIHEQTLIKLTIELLCS